MELSSVSGVNFEPPQSLLLDDERYRLNELIAHNSDKGEIPLLKIVAEFIADCVTVRLSYGV